MIEEMAEPPANPPRPGFLALYRMATVGVGLLSPAILSFIWNGYAGLRVWFGNPSLTIMELIPYALLLAITAKIHHPLPLIMALVATFLFGVYGVIGIKGGGSSTAALGFYAIPVYQVLIVIPGTLAMAGVGLGVWRLGRRLIGHP